MNDARTILVLGDSLACGLGLYSTGFLDILSETEGFDQPLRVLNPASFNCTSADILAQYRDLPRERLPDALVIALGNCDPCGFGYRKKAALRNRPKRSAALQRRHHQAHGLLRRNPPFLFRRMAGTGGRAVPVDEFKANLDTLLRRTAKDGIPVILVIPSSNPHFPPANNLGNFFCYNIFGLDAALPHNGMGEDVELLRVLRQDAAGRLEEARTGYEELAHRQDEIRAIALNNLASLAFRASDWPAAETLLGRALEQAGPGSLLIRYNQALLALARNRESEAERLFQEIREEDFATYRINAAYENALAETASGFGHVTSIGMPGRGTRDYVDYCHPMPGVHKRLARELAQALGKALSLGSGPHAPEIRQLAWNPDRAAGFKTDFFTHFGITVPPHAHWCRELSKKAEEFSGKYSRLLACAGHMTKDTLLNAENVILAHPLFGCPAFLNRIHPKERSDQGRVPELFFLRLMRPLYQRYEASPELSRRMGRAAPLVPSHRKTSRWFGNLGLENKPPDLAALEKAHQCLDWEAVLDRCKALLAHHLEQEPSYGLKYRSISYWFMREAILFGTPSSPLMLCRRLDLLKLADTCLFHFALADQDTLHPGMVRLADMVGELHDLHERHLSKIALPAISPEASAAYKRDIALFRDERMRFENKDAAAGDIFIPEIDDKAPAPQGLPLHPGQDAMTAKSRTP